MIENHRSPVVAQMLFYRVGGADAPVGKSGIAHFLEHLMFKGTPSVPDGEFSRRIVRLGGMENAFTTQDYTAYYQTDRPPASAGDHADGGRPDDQSGAARRTRYCPSAT